MPGTAGAGGDLRRNDRHALSRSVRRLRLRPGAGMSAKSYISDRGISRPTLGRCRTAPHRHPRERGAQSLPPIESKAWVPAFAEMTITGSLVLNVSVGTP